MVGIVIFKDVISEVICDWVINVEIIYYIFGFVVGLYFYLMLVWDFYVVIGEEFKQQCQEVFGWLFDVLMVCVGGGFNVMGFFYFFVQDMFVWLIGVEVVGDGVVIGCYVVMIIEGSVGVLYGVMSLLLQDGDGQVMEVYFISVGFDYFGVGLEYSYLWEIGCVEYVVVID